MLIDRKMKEKDLMHLTKLSANVMTKMRNERSVNLETLAKICFALKCELADIVEITITKEGE